ncbi:hypothetical protein HZ326_25514 [Fusarium oxysporum f. sp. albedinis]|nr:hypothetical protein HZ326_25514 [Fusarium oxysporum f. sp. albedinis]
MIEVNCPKVLEFLSSPIKTYTSVEKVALSTPRSLTSAQQTSQSALCAPEPRSPCSPLAEQSGSRQRHHSEQQRRLQSDVISLLRSLPKAQTREMLQQLRDNADLPTVLSSMQGSADSMMRPSDLRTARAILPPTGSAIEFELRAQNNTVHPKVLPLNISSLMGLLQRRNNDRMRSALSNAANSLPSVFQSNSDCLQLTKPRHSSASSQVLVPRPFLSGQYCDSRLEKLRISYWTKVPVSNKLAATLISFDIETDHKIMGFFGADVFLEDLVECRQIFCSSFLVNAVLCLACHQEYTAIKPHINLIHPAAFREAEMLWQGEGSDGSLVSLAAMGIFSAACIFEGKDKTGQEVATILRQEAERLGVCKSSASSSTTATLDLGSPELVRATSQIAWGAYNWLTYVISSRNQAYLNRTIIGSMSSSIIANPSDFLRLYQSPGILRIGICHTQVIHVIWAQRSLTHAISDETPISERVPLDFAEGKYRKLLQWASALWSDMKRVEHCTSDLIIFQWYHVSCRRGHDISPVHRNTSDSHPKAIYAASINQLKDLVFSYRANYPEASFTSYFNPGLFTLSLALLEDLQDPLWRYYFYICVRCWQDLYFCYPVFRDVAKAFLSMAMQKDAIAARETQELLQEIEQSAQHHAAANEAFTSFIFDPVFSITSEAQVHAMADRFEEMVLFNEFIERDFT